MREVVGDDGSKAKGEREEENDGKKKKTFAALVVWRLDMWVFNEGFSMKSYSSAHG
jgi:hypothetical protein